jgi:hypothetical protein
MADDPCSPRVVTPDSVAYGHNTVCCGMGHIYGLHQYSNPESILSAMERSRPQSAGFFTAISQTEEKELIKILTNMGWQRLAEFHNRNSSKDLILWGFYWNQPPRYQPKKVEAMKASDDQAPGKIPDDRPAVRRRLIPRIDPNW